MVRDLMVATCWPSRMRVALLVLLAALGTSPGRSLAGEPARTPGGALKALLSRHIGFSMLKQLALEDAIGASKTWDVDLAQGVIWFDDGERHPVQLLGTQATADETWLWAWANAESHLPPATIRASERLRALGEEKGWPELTTRKLGPGRSDGHMISLVACGLLDGAAYYRGPYQGGAAFFLLTDFPRRDRVNTRPERLQTAILTALSSFAVDAREVVRGLAADLRLALVERPDRLTLTAANGNALEIRLDRQGRIARMSATVTR